MRAKVSSAGLVMLVAALMATGCATLSHGVSQNIIVKSEPSGARVFSDGKALGVTPVMLNVWRGDRNVVLRFELDGFETKEMRLARDMSALVGADVALTVGPAMSDEPAGADRAKASAVMLAGTLGVDLLTGGAYKFPNVITAMLKRSPTETR